MKPSIRIVNAEQNNLKGISLSIPKGKITVFTGVSGSGKSSLVIDTLGAESQRLLNETYSSYLQNLLPHFDKPQVEAIENLPVSIIINQKKLGGNARSTVGTITDIYALLRLLFSRAGTPFVGYSSIFSFNNQQGMCPVCEGLGSVKQIDLDALVDQSLSLNQGAIRFPTFQPGGWRLARYTESGFFDNDLPIARYDAEKKRLLFHGVEQAPLSPSKNWHKTAKYIGLVSRIEKAFLNKESKKYQEQLKTIITSQTCPSCRGQRLNPKALSCRLSGQSIGDCVDMSLIELLTLIESLEFSQLSELLGRIESGLRTLIQLGLGYLTLGRLTGTLSGGESQRIKMSKHLNSSLSDVLYIFDEPSIGLHPYDLQSVAETLRKLTDKGNTVILVEHDPDLIKIADHVVDMGEGAGQNGGHICFEGSYRQLLRSTTRTAEALNAVHQLKPPALSFNEFFSLEDASLHNVRNVSVQLPKQALTVVTGVAGSGKSTLIGRLFASRYRQSIVLDQSPIHTNERSNLATFLNVFDGIRTIFAKASGQPAALFSYNGKGACPVCQGRGYLKMDLAFMGDTYSECEACRGKRYSEAALAFTYQGHSINDVLNMTAAQAAMLFNDNNIAAVLSMIDRVNLGYITLGQTLNTLSGGELQRLKLAKVLLSDHQDIIILDEPSTGLHEFDIRQLVKLFDFILEQGKTLIVMEHNLSVICHADWIVDMGPEGGSLGGQVLYSGPLAGLLNCRRSHTAQCLQAYIS
jgi:excinuclease UvrABC ATPase subunit